MVNRQLVIVIATLLVAGCSAFNSGGEKIITDRTPTGDPSIGSGCADSGTFDGFYTGSIALQSSTCSSLAAAAGDEQEIALDIVQSCNVVNAKFEDGSEVSGSLNANRTVLVVKKDNSSWIYDLSFNEDGVDATIEVSDSTTDGQLEACGSLTGQLLKAEKPAGWGEGNM